MKVLNKNNAPKVIIPISSSQYIQDRCALCTEFETFKMKYTRFFMLQYLYHLDQYNSETPVAKKYMNNEFQRNIPPATFLLHLAQCVVNNPWCALCTGIETHTNTDVSY